MISDRLPKIVKERLFLLLVCCIIVASVTISLSTFRSSDSASIPSTPENKAAAKVMTPNWGIAATLTAMGFPPVAMGEKAKYEVWVGKPLIPETTQDVGTRNQPNLEMFAQLKVESIIDTQFYSHLRPMYGDLPIHSVDLDSTKAVAQWDDYVEPTLQIGQYIGQPQAAKDYINHSKKQLKKAGQDFRTRHPNIKKLAVVQFSDSNNLRMYSYNSLFEPALAEMGLELTALDKGNKWGFTNITLGDLSNLEPDTCLVVIEPLSDMIKLELKNSLVWQRLGYSFEDNSTQGDADHCLTLLPATWINGGMASMPIFAERLINTSFVGRNE